jgi:hypothetical protein
MFIDGRSDPYGDQLMERCVEAALARPGWRQVLHDYDVRLVLVQKDSPLALVLAGYTVWQEPYARAVERLFARGLTRAVGAS